jgi:ribonucleoside-diphosphate reductase alpha chain
MTEILKVPTTLPPEKQKDMWQELLAFWQWYPDLFLDAVTPKDPETGEKLGIELDPSQRMFMRSMFRFERTYHCYSRGWGKTMVELLTNYTKCVLVPNTQIFLTSSTMKLASNLIKQKHAEVLRFFPFFENEIEKCSIKENGAYIIFKNGSRIDTLPNSQDAKGNRGNQICSEESALLTKAVFDDAIEPIVSEPYKNQRTQKRHPYILNGLHFITTTYFVSTDAYRQNLQYTKEMLNLEGSIVFGASWRLPIAFGRGRRESEVLKIKNRVSPLFWQTNYEERWIGGSSNSLVDTMKLIQSRTLDEPELESDGKNDYYMGVDVARSENDGNNQTSIIVVKAIRDGNKRVVKFQVVFLTNIKGTVQMPDQAIMIKRIAKNFNIKCCVVDINGLGVGLNDFLINSSFDEKTNTVYDSWEHIDYKEKLSKDPTAKRCYFPIKAQGINHNIIVNFQTLFSSDMVQLLKEVDQNEYELFGDSFTCKELSYIHTDLLVDELINLTAVPTSQDARKLTIKRQTNKYDKDRYSALAYVLYYIVYYDNGGTYEEEDDSDEMLRFLGMSFSSPRIRPRGR